jgi:hypothetical protein
MSSYIYPDRLVSSHAAVHERLDVADAGNRDNNLLRPSSTSTYVCTTVT